MSLPLLLVGGRKTLSFSVKCGNRLHVGVRSNNTSVSGFACQPFYRAHVIRGATERGVFAFACQYVVSPRRRTGNHPLLVEGRPNCARQSLASTSSAPRVAATSWSPRKCRYPLFAYPPFKRAQFSKQEEAFKEVASAKTG